jgi:hypothetical protein
MSDEQDAPPSRVGEAVQPKLYIWGGIGPDGNFIADFPDDEMAGRGLMNFLMHELDRYYVNKRMKKLLEGARDRAEIANMMGGDAKRLDRKLRGLR